MQGKEAKAVTAEESSASYAHSRTEGCFILTFWAIQRGTKGQSLKLGTDFHQTSPWQETCESLKFNTACAAREEVWHAATKQSGNSIKGSVSFLCSKQAGSGGTAQIVIECPVNRLSINTCVWKQSSCGSLWKMWKYRPKPSGPRCPQRDTDGRSVSLELWTNPWWQQVCHF